MALNRTIASRSVTSFNVPRDSGFAICQHGHQFTGIEFLSQATPHMAIDFTEPEEKASKEMTITKQRKQNSGSNFAFDQEAQYVIALGHRSLRECSTCIYKKSAENQTLIQKLGKALGPRESGGEQQIEAPHKKFSISRNSRGREMKHDSAKVLDCSASEVLPEHIPKSSPVGYFEQSSSFYPERYTTKGLFSNSIYVVGMIQPVGTHKTQKYFLLFAENPRRWRRITVLATFETTQDQSATLGAHVFLNVELQVRLLPKLLSNELNMLLPDLELFKSVTSLSLSFKEDESGQLFNDSTKQKICEDVLEVHKSREDRILNDLKHLNCAQFLERDVLVEAPISSSRFKVLVASRTCVERKVPFVNSTQGEKEFQAYFEDLKRLRSMHGCNGVAEFIGVVVDDTRSHLRSYLYEYPAIDNLFTILTCAGLKSEVIPWHIRENWAQQIVEAVSAIHRKGFLVGYLKWFSEIGVRADGRIILAGLRTSQRQYADYNGYMAPELRDSSRSDTYALNGMVNFSTEIFQLGFILWKLAEQKCDVFPGYFCAKSGCVYRPRYLCTADHANPITLPTCPTGIPTYFNNLITQCRLSDPNLRPTAFELAEMFPPRSEDDKPTPAELHDIFTRYAYSQIFYIQCIECGTLMTNTGFYYHCSICYQANFNLCQTCAGQEARCFDLRHRLTKRMVTNDGIILNVPD